MEKLLPGVASPTLAQVRLALRDALREKYGEREAAAMARLILMNLKGWDLSHLMADEDREASDYIVGKSQDILNSLLEDMPLQYALGETTFYGLKLKVRPGVLIPRPETEELVDLIVKENGAKDLRVLDLCTGSGAIALALARNLAFADVTAIDVSADALEVAKENAALLKADVNIGQADIFEMLLPENSFDIIVSNPPYVDESEKKDMEANVLKYEPHVALFVPDDDPLVFYKVIVKKGMAALKSGGRLYLEINPRHADDMRRLLAGEGFEDIRVIKDFNGFDRFVEAVKPLVV